MGVIRRGLLGGSFDPVHCAHIELARHALQHLSLGSVVLIPAARPWQRDSLGATPAQRLDMLRLATVAEPGLEVSDIEIKRSGPTYTIDTIKSLPSDTHYVWILGADQLQNFCSWKDWKQIVACVDLAVAGRPGSNLAPPPALHEHLQAVGRTLHLVPMPAIDISATAIRRRLALGQSVEGMLHPTVAQYIQHHGLYRNPAA